MVYMKCFEIKPKIWHQSINKYKTKSAAIKIAAKRTADLNISKNTDI